MTSARLRVCLSECGGTVRAVVIALQFPANATHRDEEEQGSCWFSQGILESDRRFLCLTSTALEHDMVHHRYYIACKRTRLRPSTTGGRDRARTKKKAGQEKKIGGRCRKESDRTDFTPITILSYDFHEFIERTLVISRRILFTSLEAGICCTPKKGLLSCHVRKKGNMSEEVFQLDTSYRALSLSLSLLIYCLCFSLSLCNRISSSKPRKQQLEHGSYIDKYLEHENQVNVIYFRLLPLPQICC